MVNGSVQNIFSSSVYLKSLLSKGSKSQALSDWKKWRKELLAEIHQIRAIDDEGQAWSHRNYWGGYTSYSSSSQSFDKLYRFSSTFADLEKKIRPHALRFAKALHWDLNPRDLQISTFWVNVMPEGTTHSFHLHPLSVISGTFYVQVPKGSSGLQFEDPRLGLMMACPPRRPRTRDEQSAHFTLNPKEGDLVLFESWMKHQVPPQPVAQERISISFNYDWIRR
jgi:uncharacterized protein (TIGR02466 family)